MPLLTERVVKIAERNSIDMSLLAEHWAGSGVLARGMSNLLISYPVGTSTPTPWRSYLSY